MPNEAIAALNQIAVDRQSPVTPLGSPYVKTEPRNDVSKEQMVSKMVLERMSVSEAFDRPFKERALLHWMQVQSILPANWPFWSRYFDGETANSAHDHIESVMTPFFLKDIICRIKAMDDQGEIERALTQLCMDYALSHQVKIKQAWYYLFQEDSYFGNGVMRHVVEAKDVQHSTMRQVTVGDRFKIPVGMERVQTTTTEYWPKVRNVSRFDCYPGPTGSTIQEMPYFIERVILPLEQIRSMKRKGWRHTEDMRGFFLLDRTEGYALGEWSERHFDLVERLAAVGYDVQEGVTTGQTAIKFGEALVYSQAPAATCYGCDRVIILGDRQHLLWDSAWPRPDAPKGGIPQHHGLKSYSEIKFRPRIGQVWQAKGVPEILEDQQTRLNVQVNTAQDMIAEQRNPHTLVEHNAGVDDLSELVRKPGKISRVIRASGIIDRIAPRVPDDVWKDIERIRGNIARYGKVADYTTDGQGSLGKGAQTASGLEALADVNEQSKTFQALLSEQGLQDGLSIILSDIQQTMTQTQRMKIGAHNRTLMPIAQKGFVEVSPEDIQGQYHVEVIGPSRTYSKARRAQVMLEMGNVMKMLPGIQKRVKEEEVFAEIYELSGLDDPKRFLRNDEEQQQYEQMMSQQPHPSPEILKMLVSKAKDFPEDIQQQIELAAGLKPSFMGGATKLDDQLAKIIKMVLEHEFKHMGREHQAVLDHLKPQKPAGPASRQQPRFLPKRA